MKAVCSECDVSANWQRWSRRSLWWRRESHWSLPVLPVDKAHLRQVITHC